MLAKYGYGSLEWRRATTTRVTKSEMDALKHEIDTERDELNDLISVSMRINRKIFQAAEEANRQARLNGDHLFVVDVYENPAGNAGGLSWRLRRLANFEVKLKQLRVKFSSLLLKCPSNK